MIGELNGPHDVLPMLTTGGRVVSVLPAAHIADRWASHYSALMAYGHTVTPCPSVPDLFDHVKAVRPTVFGAVPRIWEKLHAGLVATMGDQVVEAARQGNEE